MIGVIDDIQDIMDDVQELLNKYVENYEDSKKFPFISNIGRKYQPNISHRVIYHRCRDRC